MFSFTLWNEFTLAVPTKIAGNHGTYVYIEEGRAKNEKTKNKHFRAKITRNSESLDQIAFKKCFK